MSDIHKTIEALTKRKAQLEADLRNVAADLFQSFKDDTGVSPQSAEIITTEVTTFGDKTRRYAITEARVNLDIFI